MAKRNYDYVNEYIFEGEPTALEDFEEAIAKAKEVCQADENKVFMKELFAELGMLDGYKKLLLKSRDIDWNIEWDVEGIYNYDQDDGYKAVIMRITEYADNYENDNLYYLLSHIKGLCPAPVDFRRCGDYGCKTNSKDLFPEMYYVNCPELVEKGIDKKYFMDDDDVLDTFKGVFDIPEDTEEISDLMDWCEENDIECTINEIERVYAMAISHYNYGLDTRTMSEDANIDDINEAVGDLFIKIHNEVTCCVNVGQGFFASTRLRYQGPAILFKEPIDKELLAKYILDFGCSEVKDEYFLGYDYGKGSGSENVADKDGKELFAEYLMTGDIETLRQSGEKGYVYAMTQLSNKMEFDDDAEEEALNWLIKAAESGEPEAQYNLARKYYNDGDLEPEDVDTVYSLMSKSAEAGCKDALKDLITDSELNLTAEQKKYWIEKAANAGIEDAIGKFAEICYNAKDYNRAIILYTKVSQNYEHQWSMPYQNNNLATMYYEGLGCDVDYMKAAYYFNTDTAKFQLALVANHETIDSEIWKSLADKYYQEIKRD